MVQEFHVLRCFACETFQVQQVKKAKKWNCKMCGEKQSVIKEYGRGSGADCRRHVQKLNGLRGQQLEEENERAWARWEEEDDEVCESNQEEPALPSEPHQNVGGSRWSKYVETAVIPDVDEEEEENIYTESKRFSSQRNIRKRKRGRGARQGFGCRDDNEEEEDRGVGAGAWRRNKSPIKPQAHTRPVNPSATWEDHTFSTPPLHSNTPKPATASQPLSSGVPTRNVPGNQHRPSLSTEPNHNRPTGLVASDGSLANVSINRKSDRSSFHSVNRLEPESKSSKWSRFLTSPSDEDQENNVQGDPHWSDTDQGWDVPVSVTQYSNSDSLTGFENRDSFKAKPEKTIQSSGLFGALPGMSSRSGVVEKIKSATACFGFVNATHQMPSPTFTTQTIGGGRPVCHQPPPAKRPCPGLATSSLFQTDEDFDDAF